VSPSTDRPTDRDRHRPGARDPHDLPDDAGLAHPGLAHHEHRAAAPGSGGVDPDRSATAAPHAAPPAPGTAPAPPPPPATGPTPWWLPTILRRAAGFSDPGSGYART
jgi:hypothetical protein